MCKILDIHTDTVTKGNEELLAILQIAGGNFPIGGFSQSFGLETYIAEKKITDSKNLKMFINTYVVNVLCKNEAPLLIAAYRCAENNDSSGLEEINDISLASKITKESRAASDKSGRACIRIGKGLLVDEFLNRFYDSNKKSGIAYNVAFAIIAQRMKISLESAVLSFLFSNVNCIVQAAVKLIPLGNIEGQVLFRELLPIISKGSKTAFEIAVDEISNFAPALDMASIEHETLPTRLYMS